MDTTVTYHKRNQEASFVAYVIIGIYGTEHKMRFLHSSYFINLSTDKSCEQQLSIIFYSKSCERGNRTDQS